ncbi:MAG TPA: hypothetical protein VLL77_00785 [Anaerolineales bacterium]|nr:hypothetical protein [Anaerolineales bacterium]
MQPWDQEAKMLADRVVALNEPYRQNTIAWLETCTQTPILDLQNDLRRFLVRLHPIIRESFLLHTSWILDEAVSHFGCRHAAAQSSRLSIGAL